MRVLVIGGSGFIGRYVTQQLSGNHDVVVLHRGRTPSLVEAIVADRDDPNELRRALLRIRPDVVIDMIPYTEAQARALVEASRGSAERLVVISSGDVYRNYDGLRRKTATLPDLTPLDEDAPRRETRFPYRGEGYDFDHADDYDKILVEHAVAERSATVLRLPAVYGPGDAQHRLRPYLQRMTDQRPAIVLSNEMGSWRWTRGYVENVAAAIALAATDSRATGRTYNLGEDPAPTEREWIQRIGDAIGWGGRVAGVPATDLPEKLRLPYDWRFDLHTTAARIWREIGFVDPISGTEAMRRSVEWELGQREGWSEIDYSAEDEVLSRSERLA
jgi:nucleoside-diphosphate-sugar epimerase